MIRENLIRLIDWYGSTDRKRFGEFAEKTGVGRESLKQFYHGKQKLNNENLDQIIESFPEYALWLVTGTTIPESGQISPDLSGTRTSLRDAVVTILVSMETTGTLLTPEQTADLILEQLNARQDDRVENEEAI